MQHKQTHDQCMQPCRRCQHSTAQRSAAQRSAAQRSTAQHSTAGRDRCSPLTSHCPCQGRTTPCCGAACCGAPVHGRGSTCAPQTAARSRRCSALSPADAGSTPACLLRSGQAGWQQQQGQRTSALTLQSITTASDEQPAAPVGQWDAGMPGNYTPCPSPETAAHPARRRAAKPPGTRGGGGWAPQSLQAGWMGRAHPSRRRMQLAAKRVCIHTCNRECVQGCACLCGRGRPTCRVDHAVGPALVAQLNQLLGAILQQCSSTQHGTAGAAERGVVRRLLFEQSQKAC